METIILYTTHCPKCSVIEKKLEKAGIEYTMCDNVSIMREKGFVEAPMLQVGEKILDFPGAVKWINGGAVNAN